MGNGNTNNNPNMGPNSPYLGNGGILIEDKHRIIVKLLRIENKHLAKPGELVVDFANGIIYTVDEKGQLQSKAAVIEKILRTLRDSGIVSSALAYVNNSEVHTIYASGSKCRLSDRIRLSKHIRYYAIRDFNEEKGYYEYVTGVKNTTTGEIDHMLIDVDHTEPVHQTTNGPNPEPSFYTGVGTTGNIYKNEIYDGTPMFLDFFDVNRCIISSVPCQIINISEMSFLQTPNIHIEKLVITSNQNAIDDVTGKQYTYVYEGQPLGLLDFWVHAVYVDGSTRLLNADLATGRLQIKFPESYPLKQDNIDPNKYVPYEIDDEFDVEFKYFLFDDWNDPNAPTTSISAIEKIRVVRNIYRKVEMLMPMPYVKGGQVGGTTPIGKFPEIDIKTFALYEDGSIENVSESQRLSFNDNAIFSNLKPENPNLANVKLKLGYNEDAFTIQSFSFKMTSVIYGMMSYEGKNSTGLRIPGYKDTKLVKNGNIPLFEMQYSPQPAGTQGTPGISGQLRFKSTVTNLASSSDSGVGGFEGIAANEILNQQQLIDLGTVVELQADGTEKPVAIPNAIQVHSIAHPGYSYTMGPVMLDGSAEKFICDYFDAVRDLYKETLNPGNVNGISVRYPILIEFDRIEEVNGKRIIKAVYMLPALAKLEPSF